MIAYRLEHKSLTRPDTKFPYGPFCDEDMLTLLHGHDRDAYVKAVRVLFRSLNVYTHPTPWVDPELRGIRPNEVCGVDSEYAIRDWFGKSLDGLERCGFVINKYDVPDGAARRGAAGQVVFDYLSARRIKDEESQSE